ncbi:ABC transporter [Oxalobacteraceae bacterium OM1]|nr:ABC transporter [Oxalobacteraceae bacterium OM1]
MIDLSRTARLLLLSVLLAGCATPRSETPHLFDFGPIDAPAGTGSRLPPVSVAEVTVPSWLDRPQMFYRLNYANAQQPLPYAQSRWSMAPAQLLSQRIKARIVQAGGVALSAADGALNVPVLRVEADDFSQSFIAPNQSIGQVSLRAAVFNGRNLVAQKSFVRQAAAPTPDAAGGATAIAQASDAAIADMIAWLATLPLKDSQSR